MATARWKDKPQLAALVGTEVLPATTIAGGNDTTKPTPVALAANSDIGITTSALKKFIQAGSRQSLSSAATITPDASNDLITVSALAVPTTISNPVGEASPGDGFLLSIYSAAAQPITWGGGYVGMDGAPVAVTVAGKLMDIPVRYSSVLSQWLVYKPSVQA